MPPSLSKINNRKFWNVIQSICFSFKIRNASISMALCVMVAQTCLLIFLPISIWHQCRKKAKKFSPYFVCFILCVVYILYFYYEYTLYIYMLWRWVQTTIEYVKFTYVCFYLVYMSGYLLLNFWMQRKFIHMYTFFVLCVTVSICGNIGIWILAFNLNIVANCLFWFEFFAIDFNFNKLKITLNSISTILFDTIYRSNRL